ncbi:MAG: peptide/nickel transport system substrate-binding protein, partial [Miltoncostaeaceae bacterium]|nr:peptide/nickel transport system substrate-binding protein [Miltoncostaeaceae bacterium]
RPFAVTFRIRRRAAWSDGVPVTSADAVFTWRTMLDPANRVASRTPWDRVATIRVGGPRRFTVVFKAPYAAWRDLFSPSGGNVLLPRHALSGRDFNTVWNRGGVIGTGPYVLSSYTPGQRLVLTPSPRYWNRSGSGGGPFVSRIVNVYLDGSATQRVQFEGGEVNFVAPPDFTLIPTFRALPGTRVQAPPGVTWEHLEFNAQDPVLRDVNVRRAIASAVDRRELISVSTRGEALPLDSFLVPQQRPYFRPSWAGVGPDPAAVDRYLRTAGYIRNGAGFYAKDGRELTVEVAAIAGNQTRRNNLTLMQAQLQRVGIRMRPRLLANLYAPDGPLYSGRYQIAEVAYSASADPSVTNIFRSDQVPSSRNGFSGQNTFRYADPQLDRLLNAADRTIDVAGRAALMHRIQDRVRDRMVLLPLYQWRDFVAYRANLRGVRVNPTAVSHYDFTQGWWFVGGRAAR